MIRYEIEMCELNEWGLPLYIGDMEGLWNELARLELGSRMLEMFCGAPALQEIGAEVGASWRCLDAKLTFKMGQKSRKSFDVLSNILPIWDVTVNWISPMSKGKSVTSIVGRLLIAAS
ncbi:hypothetical protein Tco_0925536 [Tanacetum coccineum]|uniref:Uncharacterized protein n=1 Tax=Tanacetum coccineum TaxID=301880 RepID=A0ABQ5D9R5_9ASTR